jgi:hypothetical protein
MAGIPQKLTHVLQPRGLNQESKKACETMPPAQCPRSIPPLSPTKVEALPDLDELADELNACTIDDPETLAAVELILGYMSQHSDQIHLEP